MHILLLAMVSSAHSAIPSNAILISPLYYKNKVTMQGRTGWVATGKTGIPIIVTSVHCTNTGDLCTVYRAYWALHILQTTLSSTQLFYNKLYWALKNISILRDYQSIENDVNTANDLFLKVTGAFLALKVWRISPHTVHVFNFLCLTGAITVKLRTSRVNDITTKLLLHSTVVYLQCIMHIKYLKLHIEYVL